MGEDLDLAEDPDQATRRAQQERERERNAEENVAIGLVGIQTMIVGHEQNGGQGDAAHERGGEAQGVVYPDLRYHPLSVEQEKPEPVRRQEQAQAEYPAQGHHNRTRIERADSEHPVQ